MLSDYWESPSTSTEAPNEFNIIVEVYLSNAAAVGLRKPPTQRKKATVDKRDSLLPTSRSGDDSQKKIREKTSWMSFRPPAGVGHWKPATCKLWEEGDRTMLNISIEQSLYQTVYIHTLNHTDIRQADTSLFLKKDCIGMYCQDGQRWSATQSATTEPLYLNFESPETCRYWLALLRSYAIPEIYGRSESPADGGWYRMWREVNMTIVEGRNLGNQKPLSDSNTNSGPRDPEADAVDLDVYCEIQFNERLCGRTTIKKGIGSPEWHEPFTFTDLPPFGTLNITLWREKKTPKPIAMGSVRIALSNFRRGETVEGWFPVLNSGPIASSVQVGDVRMKIRIDEEIVLPLSCYSRLIQTINSRNFLDWIGDCENKLLLKTVSRQLIWITMAHNTLNEQILVIADREVDGTPHSHNTIFRGNTILTKTMEQCMALYGKAFLEASLGSAIRRLCSEKVTIEVDPNRNTRGAKDIEKNVELLVHWCQEFWSQIYAVRGDCPSEIRQLLEHIRKLVERQYHVTDAPQGSGRDLPWQSVSAFCFLRFIAPGILNPHLFGLCPGRPPPPVQRSLTLIAKVIQSLANLNTTVAKEAHMGRGVITFLQTTLPKMVDYLTTVSTYEPHTRSSIDLPDRSDIANALRRRGGTKPALVREAVPLLPYLLDIPAQLASVTAAVIRTSRGEHYTRASSDDKMDELIARCCEVEATALQRVSQLASRASDIVPASPTDKRNSASPTITPRYRKPSVTKPPPSSHRQRKISRPVTAPSQSDLSDRQGPEIPSDTSLPSSPVSLAPLTRLSARTSQVDLNVGQPSSPEDVNWSRQGDNVDTTDSAPSYSTRSPTEFLPKAVDSQNESDDQARKKKGILRGILMIRR